MSIETVIIEVKTDKADIEQIQEACFRQTGDNNPFFCPEVKEGEPYDGHVHAFPSSGVKSPSNEPIIIISSESII
jgi:hypothetical protein